jgi:DNA-binding NarL/FixJ family response regulator
MRVIAEAANGREAIQEFRTHQPDVTLMDLQMREMSGPDAISALRGEFSEARIIVLTTYSGDVHVIRALKADARGYLMKDVRDRELLDAIRTVHVGRSPSLPKTPSSSPSTRPTRR